MTNRERKQIRKRIISASGHRSLRRTARRASLNAQRASRVLDIPYNVIKNGVIYTVLKDKWVAEGKVDKITSEKPGLRKGSKLCL